MVVVPVAQPEFGKSTFAATPRQPTPRHATPRHTAPHNIRKGAKTEQEGKREYERQPLPMTAQKQGVQAGGGHQQAHTARCKWSATCQHRQGQEGIRHVSHVNTGDALQGHAVCRASHHGVRFRLNYGAAHGLQYLHWKSSVPCRQQRNKAREKGLSKAEPGTKGSRTVELGQPEADTLLHAPWVLLEPTPSSVTVRPVSAATAAK
jgi:hypothetical protein